MGRDSSPRCSHICTIVIIRKYGCFLNWDTSPVLQKHNYFGGGRATFRLYYSSISHGNLVVYLVQRILVNHKCQQEPTLKLNFNG
jgi:hypothetical protein